MSHSPASPPAPIIIDLSEEEALGHRLAGTAPDEFIAGQIEIVLGAGGMESATAKFMAEKLAKAGLRAREKIRVATRYEIRVAAPPKPSTLLSKKKPKPKAKSKKGAGAGVALKKLPKQSEELVVT